MGVNVVGFGRSGGVRWVVVWFGMERTYGGITNKKEGARWMR